MLVLPLRCGTLATATVNHDTRLLPIGGRYQGGKYEGTTQYWWCSRLVKKEDYEKKLIASSAEHPDDRTISEQFENGSGFWETFEAVPSKLAAGVITTVEVLARAPSNYMNQRPLTALSDEARACAFVAHECYNPQRADTLTGGTAWPAVQLQIDPDLNDPVFVVYIRTSDGCPILGFTGTRFGTPEVEKDILPDGDLAVCGAHRLVYENPWIYGAVRKVATKYGRQVIVTGHSLGGSRALIAAMGGGWHTCRDECR